MSSQYQSINHNNDTQVNGAVDSTSGLKENGCKPRLTVLAILFLSLIALGFIKSYRQGDLHRKNGPENDVSCFPKDFLIGTATSAYQVEGGWNATGREPSIWDSFCRTRESVQCANVADDMVHRYRDDIRRMHDMGLSSFRFSISWSRVMKWDAESRRMVRNEEGLAFYHGMIEELHRFGIVPVVTMFHWDLPLSLNTELSPPGFLNPEIVSHFSDYAELVLREYGDVLYWSTFNEPFTFAQEGYGWGGKAPGYGNSPTNAYLVAHFILLSHASAVQVFRNLKENGTLPPKAQISINLNYEYRFPFDPSNPKDVAASERSHQFGLGWFLNPIIHGDYPPLMKQYAGKHLPQFTDVESQALKGSYDLLMLNHYSSRLATDCDSPQSLTACKDLTIGWQRDLAIDDSRFPEGARVASVDAGSGKPNCGWFNGHPPGYLETIRYVHRADPSANILLTENGWCGNETIQNEDQLWYHQTYLQQVTYALQEGIPVIGYHAWSFLDNYEWGSYNPRFGLFYVEFPKKNQGSKEGYIPKETDLERIPRPAAHFISKVAKTKCLS